MPDPLDLIIPGNKDWQRLPTHVWDTSDAFNFFVEHLEASLDPFIFKIETSKICFEMREDGCCVCNLHLDCHKATEEEIEEYKKR